MKFTFEEEKESKKTLMTSNVKAFILSFLFLAALQSCQEFLHYWGSPDTSHRIFSFITALVMVNMFIVFFRKYMKS